MKRKALVVKYQIDYKQFDIMYNKEYNLQNISTSGTCHSENHLFEIVKKYCKNYKTVTILKTDKTDFSMFDDNIINSDFTDDIKTYSDCQTIIFNNDDYIKYLLTKNYNIIKNIGG